MTPRIVVALVVSLVCSGVAGCSADPALDPNTDDVETAATIWTDPWVAPESTGVPAPGPGGSGAVGRTAGTRATSYRGSPREVARQELVAATSLGWRPTSSSCGEAIDVALVQTRTERPATAHLRVEPQDRGTLVTLVAFVPHHLDTEWSPPAAVSATCLDPGDTDAFDEPANFSEPLRDDPLPDAERPEWQRDMLDAEEQRVVERLVDDAGLRALGLTVDVPTPATDDWRRDPVSGAAESPMALDDLVATLSGWHLTFTACGGGGPTRATFVDPGRTAVLRAVIDRGTAQVQLTGPLPEGPPADWLADVVPLDDPPCLDETPVDLTVTGTPAVLPTELVPIAGS